MSKYTTQVRFICESKCVLEESCGFSDVDWIISKSWRKIFTSNVKFFDERYREVLCKKILKHYYLREIGTETVGIWLLWVNTRLEEIMPYYNKLYESEKIKFNPIYDTDLTRTHNRKENEKSNGDRDSTGNRSDNNTQNNNSNRTGNSDETKRDLYSDTPQGALTGIENETYLTNARKNTDNINSNEDITSTVTEENRSNYTDNETTTNNIDTTEDYIEKVTGKQGTESYSDLIVKFRNSFINIDKQVIDEFEDLFFGLW